MIRPQDWGSQFPSDAHDEAPANPAEHRREYDYYIDGAGVQVIPSTVVQQRNYSVGAFARVATVVEDYKSGYALVELQGTAIRERALLGAFRARKNDQVVVVPTNTDPRATWIVAGELIGEIKYRLPSGIEEADLMRPELDPYYDQRSDDPFGG